jgi:hypothetical protein
MPKSTDKKLKVKKAELLNLGGTQKVRETFSLYGTLVHIVNFLCLRANLFHLLQLKNENDGESEISNFSDSDEEEFNRKPPASKLRTYVSGFLL